MSWAKADDFYPLYAKPRSVPTFYGFAYRSTLIAIEPTRDLMDAGYRRLCHRYALRAVPIGHMPDTAGGRRYAPRGIRERLAALL